MTSRKAWSKDETFHLIALYEQNSILWNAQNLQYRNRDKKNKIISEVAAEMECSPDEIQRKIHNLRNQMSQELNKEKKRKAQGKTNEVESSKWPYFKALKFLIPPLTRKYTQSINKQAGIIAEISEQNNTAPTPTGPRNSSTAKRKQEEDADEKTMRVMNNRLNKKPDQFDQFGQYVALELRMLKSDLNKAKMMSEIRKIIVRITDEDMLTNFPDINNAFI